MVKARPQILGTYGCLCMLSGVFVVVGGLDLDGEAIDACRSIVEHGGPFSG